MSWILWAVLGVAALAALLVLWRELGAWRQARGMRLITCPETRRAASVDLDRGKALRSGLTGEAELAISDCSRWPERAGCGQECLAQIAAAHDGCRVAAMLHDWYEGKVCARCLKEIGPVTWHDHRPGFLSPAQRPVAWHQVNATDLPEVLKTHAPLCWDCLVVETFVQEHPDRMTVRPGVVRRA